MAFRAKSLDTSESPAQDAVQTAAVKLLDELMLIARLDNLASEHVADVLPYASGDPVQARKMARRWILEGVCEYIYMSAGDVVFIEND